MGGREYMIRKEYDGEHPLTPSYEEGSVQSLRQRLRPGHLL